MSKYLISDTILQDTADSLRTKLETQVKIKPSEFASKINDIVTNTGAFQVKTIQEMNALTKMKVGDYCVIKGVPTYVIPQSDVTFTRFTGTSEELFSGQYTDYMFMFRGVHTSYRKFITDSIGTGYNYGIQKSLSVDNYTVTVNPSNELGTIFRLIPNSNKIIFKSLNNKEYKATNNPYTGSINFVLDGTGNKITSITRYSESGSGRYIYKLAFDNTSRPIIGQGNINSLSATMGTICRTAGDDSLRQWEVYYARMQSTTVDHLVYQYRENSGWVDVTDDILVPQTNITPTTSAQTPRIPDGYRGFKNITVNAIQTETKTTTPTAVKQVITPASGKYLSQVTVNATPLETITITATTNQQVITPTQGNVGISQITVNLVAASVDPNIVAENIKKGVTILGITGTYEGIVPEDEYDYQLNTAKEIAGIEGGDN